MIGVLILKSGAPRQSQAPASEFSGDRSSVFLKSGAPHQSQAPASEFRGGRSSIRGRPISPRLQPRSSGVVGVLIVKSGAAHHCQAPASEFGVGRSSDFKIRGAPSVPHSSLGVQG